MVRSAVDAQVWSDISGLISEQIWRIDHGQIMQAFELFADAPRLEFLPPSPRAGVYDGRNAVHGWFVERAKNTHVSRHVISNLRMAPREDGSVEASHLLMLFRDGLEGRRVTDPMFVADVDEVFVRERDVWKIAKRVITPIFSPG
jgi:hypothetical protein